MDNVCHHSLREWGTNIHVYLNRPAHTPPLENVTETDITGRL